MDTIDPTTLGVWPVIAFFIPLLVSLVKQAGWTTQMNAAVAFLVYLVAGAAYVIVTAGPAGFTLESIVAAMTVATVVGTAAYNLFWSNLGVRHEGDPSLEERLTAATSIVS